MVEILPKDDIYKDYFLLPYIFLDYNELINKMVTIIQYPNGKDLEYSTGIIKEINENEFTHLASTKKSSSASPVVMKYGTQVIGTHKQGKNDKTENYGDFILPIFKFFKNNIKYKFNNIIIGMIYINKDDINKNIRIINSFENDKIENHWADFNDDRKKENEKEIKEYIEININGKIIEFT